MCRCRLALALWVPLGYVSPVAVVGHFASEVKAMKGSGVGCLPHAPYQQLSPMVLVLKHRFCMRCGCADVEVMTCAGAGGLLDGSGGVTAPAAVLALLHRSAPKAVKQRQRRSGWEMWLCACRNYRKKSHLGVRLSVSYSYVMYQYANGPC